MVAKAEPTRETEPKARVFISYSRKDMAFADRLEAALKEIAHAASLNKRFAPIVCRRVEDGAVPEALRRLNFIFFDDAARFEASAAQLAEALQTDIGWVRQHTDYGEAARQWAASGRAGGLLLRSPAL